MTVYGDVVFAVNTAVNFLLLLLGARLCGRPLRRLRSLGAAALGGGYAVAVLLFPILSAVWLKLLCFLLMAGIAYGFRPSALRPTVVTLLCSAALAGCMILLTGWLHLELVTFRGTVYYPVTARFLILTAGIFYLAAALLAAGALRGAGKTYPLWLTLNGRTVCVTSFHDTGNGLTDPISGKPVIVLDWRRGTELLNVPAGETLFRDPVQALDVLGAQCPEARLRLIPYSAVGGTGLLLAAPCTAKVGRRKQQPVLAAFSPDPVSDGSYEALIGGTIL